MWSCRVFLSSLHSQYEEMDCVWQMEVKKHGEVEQFSEL